MNEIKKKFQEGKGLVISDCVLGNFSVFFFSLVLFHADLNLKILKDDSACPGACQVIQW